MQVINSRGRVLLEVYAGDFDGFMEDGTGVKDEMYSYRGPGMGGYGPLTQVHRAIQTIKADHPSAKVVGLLPQLTDRSKRHV